MSKNQYVVRAGKQWAVRAEGSKRLTTLCEQQGDAIAVGRENARNQHSELRIQGRDGRFREARSYGNDPFPPRG